MSQSEVARLRQELEASAHAAWMGLHGLAEGVAKHKTISKRMETMTQVIDALAEFVGEEQAMQIWIEVGNQQEEACEQLQERKQHDTLPSSQPTELMALVAQQQAQINRLTGDKNEKGRFPSHESL